MYESKANSRTATVNMTGEVNVNENEYSGSDYGNAVGDAEAIDAEANASNGYVGSESPSKDDSLKNNDDDEDGNLKPSAICAIKYVGIPVQGFVTGFMGFGLYMMFGFILGPWGRDLPTAEVLSATSLISIFHSFSIFFGIWVDLFPIRGLSWKPYLIFGWIIFLAFNLPIAIIGEAIETNTLVILFALSQFGLQLSTTAVEGYLPWITSMESTKTKGSFQTLRDLIMTAGVLCAILFIFFAFSGPKFNCRGYEPDPTVPCTTDETMRLQNSLSESNPDDWCHMKCPEAILNYDFSIRTVYTVLITVILLSLPFCFFLREEKKTKKNIIKTLGRMWRALTKRSVWQIALYALVLGTLMHVENPAYMQFSASHISNSTFMQIATNVLSILMVSIVLGVLAKYGLGFSWHKLLLIGTLLDAVLEVLRLAFVFDIVRSPVLWVLVDTPRGFLTMLTSLPITYAVNIIAQEGLEATTASLILTMTTLAAFLARQVISMPLLSFFPLLASTEKIFEDSQEVRLEFLKFDSIAILMKLSTLYMLPMLPRQRAEAKALKDEDERSPIWGGITLFSTLVLMLYSACVATVPYAIPGARCYKLLGGQGCSEDSNDTALVILQIVIMTSFCFVIPTVLIYWPILRGKAKFSRDMYL